MLIHGVSWDRKEDTKTLVGSYLDSVQIVPFFTSSGFSHIYEDTNTLVGSYLDSVQIVPYNPKKHHSIPADVLPNDREALLQFVNNLYLNFTSIINRITTLTNFDWRFG